MKSRPLWSEVVVPVKVPSIGQIDLFKNYSYSYSVGPCAKKKKEQKHLEKQQHKNINMNAQFWFSLFD